MYQDNKKYDYIKIALRIILFVLILLLTFKVLSMIFNSRKSYLENNNMSHNLNNMQEVAIKYFKDGNTNLEVGEKKKVSLNELMQNNLIGELKDEYEFVCSSDDSFIEIMRLENEYRVKSYLVCNKKSDYIFSYIDSTTNEPERNIEPTTTTTQPIEVETTTTTAPSSTTVPRTTVPTTTTTTTAAPTTTTTQPVVTTTQAVEFVTVSFLPNGGNYIKPITVGKGTIVNLPTPTRDGFEFVYWELNGQKIGNSITLEKNTILKPVWIQK